jgi:hypothetical protein
MRHDPGVSILTSGIGLGIFVPSLLIERRLRAEGVAAEVEVVEGYYTADGQRRHLAHRQAYHDNFNLALMGHRMARGVESSLDEQLTRDLLDRWAREQRRRFIVWSGFWLPLLARYRRMVDAPLQVDCCRIDAVVSASFRIYEEAHDDLTCSLCAREIWLWRWEDRRTVFEIPVTDQAPLPFSARADRLVVHGGGWGLGTYRDAAAGMHGTPWAFDVVVHDRDEAAGARSGDRCFMVDPAWRTWHRGPGGTHTFPPFAAVGGAQPSASADTHALYQVIRHSKAIVSKPGGGTLIDSLASATPVVLLEPYGYAEERNGALWEHLGFGVPFARWREAGYEPSVLERLHQNLMLRAAGPDYARQYAAAIREGERA